MDVQAINRHLIEAEALRAELRLLCDDEEVIVDTLEGATNLDKVLDSLDGAILEDETLVAAIKNGLDALQKRKERLQKRVEVRRALAKKVMEIAGWSKRVCPFGTYGLRPKPVCLGALEEAKIPPKWWVLGDPNVDRRSLMAALIAGEEVPGASLEAPSVILQVRRG